MRPEQAILTLGRGEAAALRDFIRLNLTDDLRFAKRRLLRIEHRAPPFVLARRDTGEQYDNGQKFSYICEQHSVLHYTAGAAMNAANKSLRTLVNFF
jgi:hypothetical protein